MRTVLKSLKTVHLLHDAKMKLAKPSIVLMLCIGTCYFIHVSTKRIPSFAGPYRSLTEYVRNVSNELNSTGKFWMYLHTTQARGRAPQYGWGWSCTSEAYTDIMKLEITMALRANNQWKQNYFVMNFDKACSTVIFHSPSIARMIYGADVILKCPFKPLGLRRIENHTFEFTYPHFPVLPYGRYLFTLAMIKSSEKRCIVVVDTTLVPKV